MRSPEAVTTTTSNLTQAAVRCHFDESGVGHLMQLLSNVYSDKYEAVLREYSTNAHDSHVAAGQTRPIEVVLPTSLQPNLDIRDYGVGLSKNSILTVYAPYGTSTKRDTDAQVGTFGIGSKSAFTLGHQFVLTAVKDGMKTVALFALDEDNVGTVTILSETETDEPNGVLVSLPCSNPDQMRHTAERFFRFWPKGSVLVDGKQPECVFDQESVVKISEHAYQIPRDMAFNNPCTVVMGGVAYPVTSHLKRKAGDFDLPVIFVVDIGEVDIAPSREALRDTNKTINTLSRLFSEASSGIINATAEFFDDCQTWTEAEVALKKLRNSALWEARTTAFSLKSAGFYWAGHQLGNAAKVYLPCCRLYKRQIRGADYLTRESGAVDLPISEYSSAAVVVVNSHEEHTRVSRFCRRVMDDKMIRYLFISEEGKGEFDWFEYGPGKEVPVYTYAEFEEIRKSLRKTPTRSGNTHEIEYTVLDSGGLAFTAKEIKKRGKPILLWNFLLSGASVSVMDKLNHTYTIVRLSSRQTDTALGKKTGLPVKYVERSDINSVIKSLISELNNTEREILESEVYLSALSKSGWREWFDAFKKGGITLDEGPVNNEFQRYLTRTSFNAGTRRALLNRLMYSSRMSSSGDIEDVLVGECDVVIPDPNDYPLLETCANSLPFDGDRKLATAAADYINMIQSRITVNNNEEN